MKLYVWHRAPNPRRVLMFLAEKGLEVPTEDVGGEGAALRDDFLANNPHRTVPMLELDDGTQIVEAMAICRYFETEHPEPALMGRDAKEKALVEMWERRANDEGLVAFAEVFRNTHPAFRGRALPGYEEELPQVPELAERGKVRVAAFFRKFDRRLGESEFVAGDRFSVADITTLCAIDFGRVVEMGLPEECANLRRWYDAVSSRPGAKAQ